MTPRSVFTAHVVVAIAFAIPMFAAPAPFLANYGYAADATAIGLARLLAAAFATFAAVGWMARELPASAARRVAAGFAIGLAIGAIAAVWNQLTLPGNALGWTTVAVYTALSFAYARAGTSRDAPTGTRLKAG
jgi:hypothetical protein